MSECLYFMSECQIDFEWLLLSSWWFLGVIKSPGFCILYGLAPSKSLDMRLVIVFSIWCACQNIAVGQQYKDSWSAGDRALLVENLQTSFEAVLAEVEPLDEAQWRWRRDSTSWSVAMVVEHLITHDELFSREIRVLAALPEFVPLQDSLFSSDEEIMSYKNITTSNRGNAPSYLEPQNRWCSKSDALSAYRKTRNALIDFVRHTDSDLRKYYTKSGRGPTAYRDGHQLLLISIAHTQRHAEQIRIIIEEQP